MEKILRTAGVATVVIGLTASAALAQVNTPFKGKSFKVQLMTAYEACTVPNAMTDDGVDACIPPVRSDGACGFGGGQGKVQLKMITVGKIAFRVKISTLEAGCNGQTLRIMATPRRTGRHCAGVYCTTVEPDFQVASCVVQDQKCSANGQTIFPGGTSQGQIELKDIFVERGGLRTFDMGLVNNNPLS